MNYGDQAETMCLMNVEPKVYVSRQMLCLYDVSITVRTEQQKYGPEELTINTALNSRTSNRPLRDPPPPYIPYLDRITSSTIPKLCLSIGTNAISIHCRAGPYRRVGVCSTSRPEVIIRYNSQLTFIVWAPENTSD